MGCQNPYQRVHVRNMTRQWRVFCVVDEKITPDLFVVRRAVNILNKHTIRWIVLNLLATFPCNGGFCFVCVATQRKETN